MSIVSQHLAPRGVTLQISADYIDVKSQYFSQFSWFGMLLNRCALQLQQIDLNPAAYSLSAAFTRTSSYQVLNEQ